MAMDEKEFKKFKGRIEAKLNNNIHLFKEACKSGKSPEELYIMANSFFKECSSDFSVFDFFDDNLSAEVLDFVPLVYTKYSQMELTVLGRCPEILRAEVINNKATVRGMYDKWINSKKKDDLKSLKSFIVDYYGRVNFLTNTLESEFASKLSNVDTVKKELLNVTSFLDDYLDKIEEKENELVQESDEKDKKSDEKDKESNDKDSSKEDEVNNLKKLKLYLKNLEDNKDKLSNGNENTAKIVDNIIAFLSNTDDDYDLNMKLDLVQSEVLKNFNYDIDNNRFNVKNQSLSNNGAGAQDGNSNRTEGMNNEEHNKYLALAGTIDTYVGSIEDERSNILNVAIDGNNNLYETYSRTLNVYIALLKELSKRASDCKGEYDDLNEKFKEIRDKIKEKFKYEYKNGVKNRKRKVVRVKKLGLGIAGALIGAYGLSRLIKKVIFFVMFSVSYSNFNLLILPSLLVIVGAALLKKALSSNEKSVVMKYIDRLSVSFRRMKRRKFRRRKESNEYNLDDDDDNFDLDDILTDDNMIDFNDDSKENDRVITEDSQILSDEDFQKFMDELNNPLKGIEDDNKEHRSRRGR